MKVQMEISEFDFIARLRNYQQWENATVEELSCLFNFLESISDSDDTAIDFDPIAWACEFNILSADEIIRENKENVIDYAQEMDLINDDEDFEDFDKVLKALYDAGCEEADILGNLFDNHIDEPMYDYEGYYLFHAC